MKEVSTERAQEVQQVQTDFNRLLNSFGETLNEEDRRDITEAFEMAKKAHEGQKRKSGEPYILHPIEVARICAQEIGLGPTAIVAALLHDVVEDTPVTLEDIHKKFNEKIAVIVDGLTKLDANISLTSSMNASPQAENFKKVLSAMLIDVRVVLIKMADRLHNMRTLGSMPRHKQLKIASETNFIYTPLAHRLGLYNIKTEFEDMTMKVMDPDNYFDIAKLLQETKRSRENYIDSFVFPLKKVLDKEISFPFEIYGRPKSIHSIFNKIKSKQVEFEEIYDLFAIRIIVDTPLELEKPVCWHIYSIVTDVHDPIPERLKDWVTTPKSNGYESLHTTVIGPQGRYVEVQIRTKRMDEIAERGFAAHWKYKGVLRSDDVYDSWLGTIRETIEATEDANLDFLGDLKSTLFNEEVYVYTPRGDMKVLPKGSTALDFAYSIHSEVGNQCAGVKMANKMVPLDYELKNGDQLEVITNKNQRPSDDWLKFVKTARAKSKIRTALKEKLKKLASIGKETLLRKMAQLKVDYDENIDFLINEFKYQNGQELFLDIYHEKFDLSQLKNFDVVGNKLVKRKETLFAKLTGIGRSSTPSTKPSKAKKKNVVVFQDDMDFQYQLSPCCNPVVGDEIFGFINIQGGVKIHRIDCPNAEHLMANYAYRIIRAEWQDEESPSTVEFRIKGLDSGPGVIEAVSNKISSELGFNIKSFYIDGKEGYFEGKVTVVVQNKDQVVEVINKLKELKGINFVSRI